MKQFLIVADDRVEPAFRDTFTKHLQAQSYNYWHWMPNLWVIIDGAQDAGAAKWSVLLRSLWPARFFWVQEVDLSKSEWQTVFPREGSQWLVNNVGAIPIPPDVPLLPKK